MNQILLEDKQETYVLGEDSEAARHLREVVGVQVGDTVFAGVRNGPLGRLRVLSLEPMQLEAVRWLEAPPVHALDLILGLPRPQTARRILRESCLLGVRSLHFFAASKGERAYRDSKLWHTDAWSKVLDEALEQSLATTAPHCQHHDKLETALETVEASGSRLALDPYEATTSLGEATDSLPACLVLGPERGFSQAERTLLREHGYTLAHLGDRMLRLETAVVAASSIVLAEAGALRPNQNAD